MGKKKALPLDNQYFEHSFRQMGTPRLLQLRELIDCILAERENEESPDVIDQAAKTKRGNGTSWVEIKTIRGFGPYAYRRWREGGRLKSEYIGKVHNS